MTLFRDSRELVNLVNLNCCANLVVVVFIEFGIGCLFINALLS